MNNILNFFTINEVKNNFLMDYKQINTKSNLYPNGYIIKGMSHIYNRKYPVFHFFGTMQLNDGYILKNFDKKFYFIELKNNKIIAISKSKESYAYWNVYFNSNNIILKSKKNFIYSYGKKNIEIKMIFNKIGNKFKTYTIVKDKNKDKILKSLSLIQYNFNYISYIALGSNVGDRFFNIKKAIYYLNTLNDIDVIKISPIYESKPMYKEDQPNFYNCVLMINTNLSPEILIRKCKIIELKMGRRFPSLKNYPRIIDLDIILYGKKKKKIEWLQIKKNIFYKKKRYIDDYIKELEIPHRLMHERIFVLKPLLDIDKNIVHPVKKIEIKKIYNNLVSLQGNNLIKLKESY